MSSQPTLSSADRIWRRCGALFLAQSPRIAHAEQCNGIRAGGVELYCLSRDPLFVWPQALSYTE